MPSEYEHWEASEATWQVGVDDHGAITITLTWDDDENDYRLTHTLSTSSAERLGFALLVRAAGLQGRITDTPA